MTAYLNALVHGQLSIEVAARSIAADDAAHHVIDAEGRLGLDPVAANELEAGLLATGPFETEGWALTLPRPGALGSLRGPVDLTTAALKSGVAVIGLTGGVAFVPQVVGAAVQWQVFGANRPLPPPAPYEAERALNQTVLSVAATLAGLEVAGGQRPAGRARPRLAPGYQPRQQAMADKAMALLVACQAALADDGGALSAYAAELRARELRSLQAAAADALCASCTWLT